MNTYTFTRELILKAPQTPGVYIFRDERGKPIYVGKAKNLKNRLTSYIAMNLATKTQAMVNAAKTFSYIQVNSEFEALLLEANLVKKYMPQYNIELRDDKSPLYIGITNDTYPRVITLRQSDLKLYALKYVFGPYIDGGSAKYILKLLRRIIPYAHHKLGKRPCIYHQIGLCNPCPAQIELTTDPEVKATLLAQYKRNITLLKRILSGHINEVQKELEKSMHQFSKNEQYEEASQLKRALERLIYVVSPKAPIEGYIENPLLLNDIYEKELMALSQLLEPFFGVLELHRIECFDIAHLSGTSPTASMVVFTDATAANSQYRHFRIKKEKQNNDTESMREVLTRRINHFEDWGTPNLIVVDGGKGQLSKALEVLPPTIPVVGLAKRYETIVVKVGETFKEIKVPRGPALNLMQRMRNEAHRFARRYHHSLVTKTLLGTAKSSS